MGTAFSSEKEANEDRIKREKLECELRKLEYSLNVTASSHYIAAAYYRKMDIKLHFTSAFTGALGSISSVATKLSWKSMVTTYPRFAPILVALSTTSLFFTAVVHVPQIQNLPGNLSKAHFISGIECQYLEKQVVFFVETEVWDSNVSWTTLASRYNELLRAKKEVNTKVPSEYWSYRKALKKRTDREKEKELQAEAISRKTEGQTADCSNSC